MPGVKYCEKRMADTEVENDRACGANLEQVVKKGVFAKVTCEQASGNLRLNLFKQRKQYIEASLRGLAGVACWNSGQEAIMKGGSQGMSSDSVRGQAQMEPCWP